MKAHGLVQCNFPWTAHYYNQVIAFTKKLGLHLARNMCLELFVKANTFFHSYVMSQDSA